jgi:hypothetical protein
MERRTAEHLKRSMSVSKAMMATLIHWTNRAVAPYTTPEKYHHTRLRGRWS